MDMPLRSCFAVACLLALVLTTPVGADEPGASLPSAAGNAAEAPVELLDTEEAYIAPNAAESPSVLGDAGAAPALPGRPAALDGNREGELRQQLEVAASPAAYLELLQLLGARLATLRPGDEQLQLSSETETLWADALAAFPADPLLLLANGDRLRARGSLQAAWEAYQRGERQAPRDPRWTARLGGLSQQVQDYPNAIARYEESLALAYDAALVARIAECHLLNGAPAAALQTWNTALAAHPADPALCMAYGRALFAQGSYSEALVQFERGAQLDPRSDLFHNRAALCLFQLGNAPGAVEAVRRALALSKRPLYYYNLAVGLEALGQFAEAEQWYRDGLAQFPGDPALAGGYSAFLDSEGRGGEALAQLTAAGDGSAADYANRAGLAEEQGDLDAANEAWQSALAADPTSPVALTAACAFYARTADYAALVEQVRVARNRIDPEQFAELLRSTAQTFLSIRDYAGGVDTFMEIQAAHPEVPMVYSQLGLLQHMQGDSAGGLATVKRGMADVNRTTLGSYLEAFLTAKVQGADAALALGPGLVADPEADHGAFELYAGLLLEAARYPEAESVAAAGLAKYPRRGLLLQLQARALLGQQRLEDAAALLSGGTHARLEFSGKARLLGNIYMDLANYPRAVGAFTEAMRGLEYDAAPEDSAAALAELAEAQHFAGEHAGARTSCTEALAADPRCAPAQVWLGWTLLAQGDAAGAQQAFDEAQPLAGDLPTLAWLALGRARSAALAGQRANAFSFWQQASRFASGLDIARLTEGVARAKADLRF